MSRDQLLRLLNLHGVRHRASGGDEISILCPVCSPEHIGNPKLTLYINGRTGRYICYRCSRTAGREYKYFFRLFGIPYIDEPELPFVNDDTFEHATAFGRAAAQEPAKIPLPVEYRRDWEATVTGQLVLRYLKGRLSTEAIYASMVGYAVNGPLAGYAIFPVALDQETWFWQARTVLFPSKDKYVSPPGAAKARVLYGLDWLHGKRAVLVEGIFDALNTPDAVALLGKSISPWQIGLLMKHGINDITVMLDGNAYAAARAVAETVAMGVPAVRGAVTIARLHPEDDPAATDRVAEYVPFSLA